MTLKIRSHIRKRHAVYLPQKIVRHLKLTEGDSIEITVVDNEIHIRPIPDPLRLALHGEKFTSISPETIEQISEEEQQRNEDTS